MALGASETVKPGSCQFVRRTDVMASGDCSGDL